MSRKSKRKLWKVKVSMKDFHRHMRMRQIQNLRQCKWSKAEAHVFAELKARTKLKWTRQAQSGTRLFDFWNAQLGIAIEVDGPEHNAEWDRERDKLQFQRRGIQVLRIRNFNEDDLEAALLAISVSESWAKRRSAMLLNPFCPLRQKPPTPPKPQPRLVTHPVALVVL